MNTSRSPRLVALDARGRGVAVAFARADDRWRHTLYAVNDGSWLPAGESVEGDASLAFPPSPPLQELSAETMATGSEVIFLVGKAGGSHWSASIEAQLDPAGRPQLIFDIACRHGGAAAWLGSQYRRQGSGGIEIHSALEGTEVTQQEALWAIAPRAGAGPGARTTRWKYAVCRVPHD